MAPSAEFSLDAASLIWELLRTADFNFALTIFIFCVDVLKSTKVSNWSVKSSKSITGCENQQSLFYSLGCRERSVTLRNSQKVWNYILKNIFINPNETKTNLYKATISSVCPVCLPNYNKPKLSWKGLKLMCLNTILLKCYIFTFRITVFFRQNLEGKEN